MSIMGDLLVNPVTRILKDCARMEEQFVSENFLFFNEKLSAIPAAYLPVIPPEEDVSDVSEDHLLGPPVRVGNFLQWQQDDYWVKGELLGYDTQGFVVKFATGIGRTIVKPIEPRSTWRKCRRNAPEVEKISLSDSVFDFE